MAFTTANLSLYHSFSKMPAQNSTTLGNAINKSGHTVTASEVWAQDIPYYGKMGSIEDVKSKVQPYARKNDMCYITAGADKGKTFQYDGDGNWTDITSTLIDGALIKNANDDVVLLYHKGQTLTNLTAENNANTDSANNAARLWAKRDTEGVTIADNGTRLIEQFVAPTDKALNGLASVAYAPVIANGSLISGTNYYDYCFSGTILWATARTAATLIDCFEYVGQKVSTVVDTVATNAAEIKSVKDQVDTISESLGLGATPGQDTLGSRVSKTESALRTMLGLGTDAEVVASQSIAKSIQDAIDALGEVAVKSDITITDIKVKVGSGEATSLTPDANKSVTVEIPEVQAATTNVAGVVTISSDAAIESTASSTSAATVTAVAATRGAIEQSISSLTGRVAQLEGIAHFSVAVVDTLPTTLVENTIYLVPEEGKTSGNYVEYIAYKPEGSETVTTERIGTTAIDLEGYTTDDEHSALANRVTTVEGQVATLTGDATTDGSVAKALADAKSYAEEQASAAQTAAESTAASELSAAVEQIGKDIEAAKVTLTQSTGITVTPNGQASTSFTIAVDDTVATKQSVDDLSSLVSGLPATIKAAQDAADDAMEEAQAKVASVTLGTVPTGVDFGTDAKNPVLTIETAASAETVGNNTDAAKLVTGAVAKAIATHYSSTASTTVVDTIDGRSLASSASSTQGSYVSVTTAGSVGSGLTVNVDDSGLASTVSAASTAIQTVKVNSTALTATDNAVDIIAIEGVDETAANGIKVTKTPDNNVKVDVTPASYASSTKTWTNDTNFATASDVATAISDAVNNITIPVVTTSDAAQAVGVTASGHEVSVATATYTPAVGETVASWTDKGYLVTGSTVETFVGAETAKALEEAKAYSDSLHTTSLDYVVLGDSESLPTASADTLGKIYLVASQNAPTADGSAISGSYVEYMTRQVSETEYTWEKIGTTAADLTGYAKTVTINGQTYNVTANTVALGIGFANKVASGQATTLDNQGSVYANIASDGTLTLGVASATDSVKGVLTIDGSDFYADKEIHISDYYKTVAASAYSLQTGLNSVLDSALNSTIHSVEGEHYLSLAGFSVNTVDNETLIKKGVFDNETHLATGTKVVENGLCDGDRSIDTNLIAFDSPEQAVNFIPDGSQLTTWVGDMPNLGCGHTMFSNCASLETFMGDLSAMTDGESMFNGCTSLTTFISDLSSLTAGNNMFLNCTLDAESIECIAETLPTVTSGTIDIGASTNATPEVIAEIKSKGWTLMSNGVAL